MEMGGRIRGILGRHLLGKLGVVAVMSIRVTKEMGFKPCPFCGSEHYLEVCSEDDYKRLQDKRLGIASVHIECIVCRVNMFHLDWTDVPENRTYEKQMDALRRKWNKRANESL